MQAITTSEQVLGIFRQSIHDYHVHNSVEVPMTNPYSGNGLSELLYKKNYIDTVQWHLEDIIRSPSISTDMFIQTKRKIDASNQDRTDVVEEIDQLFFNEFSAIERQNEAKLNSETPAWLLDRLSILELKIYHFREQLDRSDADKEHKEKAKVKLGVLIEQEKDLSECFDDLISDLRSGRKFMKMYKQMKMYNDPSLNPELYSKS